MEIVEDMEIQEVEEDEEFSEVKSTGKEEEPDVLQLSSEESDVEMEMTKYIN